MLEDEIMAELVESDRRHPLDHMGGDEIEGLGGELAGLAHGREGFRAMQLDAPRLALPLAGSFLSGVHGGN